MEKRGDCCSCNGPASAGDPLSAAAGELERF